MNAGARLLEDNERLRRAVHELTVLKDLATAIGASLDSELIMQTIVHRSLVALGAEQGVIALVDRRPDAHGAHTLVRSVVASSDREAFHLKDALLGWMILNREALTINEPAGDKRFGGVDWDASIRNVICAPLLVKSEVTGVLALYNKRAGDFTGDDQRLLHILASQSAQVVENARLYEEERELRRVEEEMRFATEIQRQLLPGEPPAVHGYEIAGASLPARSVGGDYYDFIRLCDMRVAFCLGDVSGKGLPAAILMANLQATVRGQSHVDPTPTTCVARSNELMYANTDPHKFATFFYAVLDPETHTVTYCNAGHDSPFLFSSDGAHRRLETGGTVLGFMRDVGFDQAEEALAPGSVLVLFSDGVTEALTADGEQFGEERLRSVVASSLHRSASEIVDSIETAVHEFAGTAVQSDDVTIVVVKRPAA